MQNRRSVVLGLVLGLFNLVPRTAFGAAGPALIPTKVGQTIVWRNTKYTAIKKGKKIVWDNGIPIAKVVNTQPTATPSPSPTHSYVPSKLEDIVLAKSSDLSVGETKKFTKGKSYFVARSSTGIRIFDDVCTHEGCAVESKGKQLICPCHLAEYNPADGSVTKGPAGISLRSYDSKEIDGYIIVVDYPT